MKRRTLVLWKRLLLRLFIALAILSFLWVYFFTGTFTIKDYRIVGAPEGYAENLKTEIAYASEHKLFFVLPSNRVISYHDDEIRSAIMDLLPNTRTISIRPSRLHELTIKLTQHHPVFSISDTHAISSEGTIYKEIVPLDDFVKLEIASTTKVSKRDLQNLSEFSRRIGTVLFPVTTISIDEYDDVRFFGANKRNSVIMTSQATIDTTWSNILSAIDTEPLKSKLEKDLPDLAYIDTRFGNKIFYKFTNGDMPAIIAPHEGTATSTATTTVQ